MRPASLLCNPTTALALLSLLLLLLLASPSRAALTEADDPSLPASPDGYNLTQDDVTGLEWLDLTVTVGRTYDDIVGNDGTDELGPGGDFESFRYATLNEVSGWGPGGGEPSLFTNFGFTSTFSNWGYELVREYMDYLGCLDNCVTHGFVQGLSVEDVEPPIGTWFLADAYLLYGNYGPNVGSLGAWSGGPLTSSSTNGSQQLTGHFLVRPVPEPDAMRMLLPGLAMLAWLRRRTA